MNRYGSSGKNSRCGQPTHYSFPVTAHHPSLAQGRWHEFSLAEQLGNVGSEVGRALKWRNRNPERFQSAFDRALELLDLTIQDPRWRTRLNELVRARELLCGAVFGSGEGEHGTTLADLDRYFFRFAVLARK
jgi:hypothetical protein